jgi:L-rhamnose-H+ transport protein
MNGEALAGLLVVILAGFLVGTMTWPMKVARKLDFEHQWLPAMFVGLIVMPWAITLTGCPDALDAYSEVGAGTLLKANLFSIAWGIANVILGVCVARIGAGLTFAILTGVGATIGVLTPTIFKGTGLFAQAPGLLSPAGLTVLVGSVVMLAGVVLTARAGRLREGAGAQSGETTPRSLGPIALAALAGVLSAGISFTFVFSQGPIVEAMTKRGASPMVANASVWAVALLGGATVNVIYPLWLLARHRSWGKYRGAAGQVAIASLIGIQFFLGVLLLGKGMLLLGALGASVGFGIQQGMQILGGQTVGLLSGEWRGSPSAASRTMIIATLTLLFAAVLMALGNTLAK